MSLPPPKVFSLLSAKEEPNHEPVVDLSSNFGVAGILVQSCVLHPGETVEIPLRTRTNTIAYVFEGDGTLNMNEKSEFIDKDDCFSFAAAEDADGRTFSLLARSSTISLVFISDASPQETYLERLPDFPLVIRAPDSNQWRYKGIMTRKDVKLSSATGMGKLESNPWVLVFGQHPPGTHSSPTHCHSQENEFAIILQGKARYWHQGITPEPILKRGDCVVWNAGTGIAHTLINDGEEDSEKGEDLIFLVWGENKKGVDKLHYATSNPPWWTDSLKWKDRPELAQGQALDRPRYPRPDDVPYPA